jgi:predicted ATPase
LQVALGWALGPTKGWIAPDAERAFERARVLTQRVPETPLLFGALFGLSAFYRVRSDCRTGQEFAKQSVVLAEQAQDPDLLVEAYFTVGVGSFYGAEFDAAREQCERSIALYDRTRHRPHSFIYGQDPCVGASMFSSWAFWMLGYPEQARRRAERTLALARELSHPFSLAWALQVCSIVGVFLHQWADVETIAETHSKLCAEQKSPFFSAMASANQAVALAKQGQCDRAISQLKQTIHSYRASGSAMNGPLMLGWLSEALGLAGQANEGLAVLIDAFELSEETGELCWESDHWRLRGELLLIRTQPEESQAEMSFQRAITIARSQKAKSFELRAATGLSRLWQRQSKGAEARRVLGEVYGWFTEGFDTADLLTARTLLNELSPASP